MSDNVERFERTGIVHEKSLAEQIFDDARYDRLALEDGAPTSSKRNWLSHNRALQAQRRQRRRADLESLVPADATRVLVVGDLSVELPECAVTRLDHADLNRVARNATASASDADAFDAALLAPGWRRSARERASRRRSPSARGRDHRNGSSRSQPAAHRGVHRDGPRRRHPSRRATRRVAPRDVRCLTASPPLGSTSAGCVSSGTAGSTPWRCGRTAGGTRRRIGGLRPQERPGGGGRGADRRGDRLRGRASIRNRSTGVLGHSRGPRQARDPQALRRRAAGDGSRSTTTSSSSCIRSPTGAPIAGATSVLVAEEASLAARWNAGARAAAGELLVFVSADSVPLPGWLDALVQAHRSRPDTGAVGSKVIAEDGTIEHSGLVLGLRSDPLPHLPGRPRHRAQCQPPADHARGRRRGHGHSPGRGSSRSVASTRRSARI